MKTIKQLYVLIQENIPCAKFVKSNCANQPEKNLYRRRTKLSNTSIIDKPNTKYHKISLVHSMILKILQYFIHYWNGFYKVQVIMSRTKHVEKVLTVPYQWLVSTSFKQPKLQDRWTTSHRKMSLEIVKLVT